MKKIISLVIPFCILSGFFIILSSSNGLAMSSSPASAEMGFEPEQSGPPWFDPAWHYRRAININTDASLPYYQVLIQLGSNNFNFSRAKSDGSDIRFTHSDGTTELKYWIEVYDSTSQQAYLWVRVPAVANGETTIFIYYGNSTAASASDGNSTFDGFDDNWEQFHGVAAQPDTFTSGSAEPNSPFTWSVFSGTPTASAGILSLSDGTGIKSTASFQYQAVGMKANFGLNSVDEWIGFINGTIDQRTLVSDYKPANSNDLFLLDSVNGADFEYVTLPKIAGENWHGAFHVYELRWKFGQTSADVDHGLPVTSTLPGYVPNSSLPVTLYNDTLSNSSMLVDWVYVRKYHDPEPIAVVKSEQGLVELGIGITDSPDPFGKGTPLTYQVAISNTSSINAPGVVLTNTLPANVELLSVEPSQGTCQPGSIIYCDLNIINSNAHAQVTVVVTATMEGQLTDFASVGSPGYELDLSDNYAEETSLADWTPPVVNWEKPVHNGGTYLTFGGRVTLEASATDVGGIAWVEFKLWDHINNQWLSIGKGYSYPYQVQFNSSILAVNDPYQMFAVAVDQAGNISNPYNPLQRIFMERKLPVFIPILRK